MAEPVSAGAFADAFVPEDEVLEGAREAALRFGTDPVSPGTGAALALAAAGRPAASIIEIGTGTGVSGLWLLRGAPDAQLTTIDSDADVHHVAKAVFAEAGHTGRRVRFIPGRAADVLPRMNDGAYDLVFVDADPESVGAYTEASLRLVRPGGSVIVARVLQQGRTANPARRDRRSVAYRDLLKSVREREDVLAGITVVGDGLLHMVLR